MSSSKNNSLVQREDAWYRHPTVLWALKSVAVNFILPFFNGVMLGFGEILANEVLYNYGWFGYTRPIGIHGGIPSIATNEYKKTIQNEIKHEKLQQQQQDMLLLD